jgi:hypothetical protein
VILFYMRVSVCVCVCVDVLSLGNKFIYLKAIKKNENKFMFYKILKENLKTFEELKINYFNKKNPLFFLILD